MPFKDHYKTLEILPNADQQEVKKAYRKLAHICHPDKNPENQFSEARFREIQEAYHILSHQQLRATYDEERWLAGYSLKKQPQYVTPQWILKECEKLGKHMAGMDTYRMNHGALHDFVMLMLSDAHMAILQQVGDEELNEKIIRELLLATKSIHFPYLENISGRLSLLAASNNDLQAVIYQTELQRRKLDKWERSKPWAVVCFAIFLCILMYAYVHNNI
jgi:DnaJ domain